MADSFRLFKMCICQILLVQLTLFSPGEGGGIKNQQEPVMGWGIKKGEVTRSNTGREALINRQVVATSVI